MKLFSSQIGGIMAQSVDVLDLRDDSEDEEVKLNLQFKKPQQILPPIKNFHINQSAINSIMSLDNSFTDEHSGFLSFMEQNKSQIKQSQSQLDLIIEQNKDNNRYKQKFNNALKLQNKQLNELFKQSFKKKFQFQSLQQSKIKSYLNEQREQAKLRKLEAKNNNDEEIQKQIKQIEQESHFIFHCKYSDYKYSPETRESATLTPIGNDEILLYGGRNSHVLEDVHILNTYNYKWTKLKTTVGKDQIGRNLDISRFGHSAVYYNQNLIIFGGEIQHNKILKYRTYMKETLSFNIKNHQFHQMITTNSELEARKNHAAGVISEFMFVYGGIAKKEKLLNDFWVLNLNIKNWTQFILKNEDFDGIAYHTMIPIFKGQVQFKGNSIDSSMVTDVKASLVYIKQIGLYCFGGKLADGNSTNQLRILQIGQLSPSWITPKTSGICPTPRHQHSCSFYEKKCYLMIYGGRCDEKNDIQYKSNVLNDLFILDLNFMLWINISLNGLKTNPIFAQSSIIQDNLFISFGGYSFEQYQNGQLDIIGIDQEQNLKMYQVWKQQSIESQNNFRPIIRINARVYANREEEIQEQNLNLDIFKGILQKVSKHHSHNQYYLQIPKKEQLKENFFSSSIFNFIGQNSIQKKFINYKSCLLAKLPSILLEK